MNEHDYALRDAAMAEFVDSYFKARPQLLRTRHEECLVEAGFKAAWQPDQKERAEKAEAELAKAMDQRDGLAAKLAELCEQKPVVKYMSRRLTPVGTKEMWGYDLVDGLSDGIMLYAGPVQLPVVADCRTCKNRGCTNGLSQESFCESCVWQLMSFRKNHYAPNSPDFEEIKMVELPKNDAAPVPAVAAPAVPEEWREVMAGLVVIAEKKGKKQGSPNHCHQRPGIWDDDNGPVLSGKPCAECAMYDKARALLQSANHFVGVTEKDAARGAK